jgi:hypothetical protein
MMRGKENSSKTACGEPPEEINIRELFPSGRH